MKASKLQTYLSENSSNNSDNIKGSADRNLAIVTSVVWTATNNLNRKFDIGLVATDSRKEKIKYKSLRILAYSRFTIKSKQSASPYVNPKKQKDDNILERYYSNESGWNRCSSHFDWVWCGWPWETSDVEKE